MIQLTGAGKHYGPKILFENVDWLVTPNERTGIVGANGTGKSSLLKVLAGIEGLDSGTIVTQKGVTLGYLPQEGLSLSGRTVFAECMTVFADLRALEDEQEELARQMAELDPAGPDYAQVSDRFHRAESEFRARDGYTIEAQVGAVLSGLGFPQRDWKRRTEEFSGGWQMRIALAKLLLEKPNLLLLDEPTNHLDLEARNWLEDYLNELPQRLRAGLPRPLLPGRHRAQDRRAVEQGPALLHRRLHALRDAKGPNAAPSFRPPTTTSRTASTSWKPSSTASATRPPRPSRCRAASRSWSASSGSKFRRKRRPSTSAFRSPSRAAASWPNSREWPRATAIIRSFPDVDFFIERGDRVALVGVNGAGKSTLIKILAGAEAGHRRRLHLGHNAQPDYFAQDQYKELDQNARMIDDLATVAPRATNTELRSILGCFLFSEDDVFKTIGVLSGGERNRYALARMLMMPSNFLLLDEPTNHLDMRAKDVLLTALQEYSGHRGVRLPRPLLSSTSWPPASSKWRMAGCTSFPAITRTTCGVRPAEARCRREVPWGPRCRSRRAGSWWAKPLPPPPPHGTLRNIARRMPSPRRRYTARRLPSRPPRPKSPAASTPSSFGR